jgi:hypothetical protein
MTVPTTKNTIGGTGTAIITIEFADQAGGYMTTVASPGTAIAGVFTPEASAQLVDAATLQVNTGGTATVSGSGWDLIRPTLTSVTTADVAGAVQNGKIDRVTVVFNSLMRDSNITNGEALLGGATHTGTFTTGTANDATTRFDLTVDTLTADTSPTGAQFTYTPVATKLTDLAGNLVDVDGTDGAIANADVTETDGAAPVLLTISPVNGATNVALTTVTTLTFSEIIASLTYTPTGASTSDFTTSLAAAAVTLTPHGLMASGYHTFDILTAPDAAVNAYAGVANGAASDITDPFHYTTAAASSSGGGGGGGGGTVGTGNATVLVTAPNGGETWNGGSTHAITWSTSTNGSIAGITISYTVDAGETYNTIVTNTANDGTYSWTIPSIDADNVFVKVAATDLVNTLASDSSDSEFSIVSTIPIVENEAPTTGLSPLTGLVEDITPVSYGDNIKSPSYDTVYFVDWAVDGVTLIRRPFNDSQTYFTYNDDFNDLVEVTDATLVTLSLGAPMMPNPGVVLVKIQSVPKVYFIGADGELRWVTSEEIALLLFGDNWSDYVIDIPDTLYPRFEHGADMLSDDYVNRGAMKTRATLNQ